MCYVSEGCCEQMLFVFMLCTDSVVERRALRESVFPKLREHCRHTLGLDVRVSTHTYLSKCVMRVVYFRCKGISVVVMAFTEGGTFSCGRNGNNVTNLFLHL